MSTPKEAARTALEDAQERVLRAALNWRFAAPSAKTSSERLRDAVDALVRLDDELAKRWPEGLR